MSEIRQQLHRLASSDPSTAEAALARLTLQGARMIEPLLETYPSAIKSARLRMLLLLARVPDGRSLDLLAGAASDSDAEIRRAAAQAAGRLRSTRGRSLLLARLSTEPDDAVRETVVRALAHDAADGAAELLDHLLDLVFDRTEALHVRMAGLPALSSLAPADARRLLERLASDAGDPLAAEARSELGPGSLDGAERLAARLAAEDERGFAVSSLKLRELGLQAVPSVLRTLATHAEDPDAAQRCVWTLEGMPTEARRDVAHRLDPDWPPEMLGAALKALGGVRDRQVLMQLKKLAGALTQRIQRSPESGVSARLRPVHAQVHLLLARAGSRLAVSDLKDALAGAGAGAGDLVLALEHVGRPEDAGDLLAVYLDGDDWLQARVRQALLAIGKRDGVARLRRISAGLPPQQSAILSRLLAPPRRHGFPPGTEHSEPTE